MKDDIEAMRKMTGGHLKLTQQLISETLGKPNARCADPLAAPKEENEHGEDSQTFRDRYIGEWPKVVDSKEEKICPHQRHAGEFCDICHFDHDGEPYNQGANTLAAQLGEANAARIGLQSKLDELLAKGSPSEEGTGQ